MDMHGDVCCWRVGEKEKFCKTDPTHVRRDSYWGQYFSPCLTLVLGLEPYRTSSAFWNLFDIASYEKVIEKDSLLIALRRAEMVDTILI